MANYRTATQWLLGCILVSSLQGCADAGSDHDSESGEPVALSERGSEESGMTLLARIDLEHGSISYLEPEPGVVLESEVGELGDPKLRLGRDLTFVERYELLAGRSAPEALVAAEQRATRIGAALVESGQERGESLTFASRDESNKNLVLGTAMSEELFLSAYCVQQDRWYGGLHLTGNSGMQGTGINYMKSGVYVVSGNIRWRVTYTGSGGPSGEWHTIYPGHYGGFRLASTLNRSASSYVRYADGADYHHCVNYHF